MRNTPKPLSKRVPLVLFCIMHLFCMGGVPLWCEVALAQATPKVQATPNTGDPTYVGRSACAGCHALQDSLFKGSDHDRSMDLATEKSVLGDFKDTSFTYFGVTSKFFRRGKEYFVLTDGPDGKMTEYRVKYVFGYFPLQQYLLDFGNGFYQALNVCWDTRPKSEGGQRWFHLYPKEEIRFNDPLHWTKRLQTWNYSCAECHSTNLHKNFDEGTASYKTTWSEINVSCEACHGPGSQHVEWAKQKAEFEKVTSKGGKPTPAKSVNTNSPELPNKGLVHQLKRAADREWIPSSSGTAKLKDPDQADLAQVETCARCHSRRVEMTDHYTAGQPLLNSHRPELLNENLYYPDGQINAEVFEYGSFLQSKMYNVGVRCSDCHDPHSDKLYVTGNALCSRCHAPATFDTPAHHFHKSGTPGANCVDCHAPKTNYMVVDGRADHSFRIPRPDLTDALQSTDACSKCHADKPLSWSKDAFSRLFGSKVTSKFPPASQWGAVFYSGRQGKPGSGDALERLANDTTKPTIVRATALSMLGGYPRDRYLTTITNGVEDKDGLIRFGAAQALAGLSPQPALQLSLKMASDPLLSNRLEAAATVANLLSGNRDILAKLSPVEQGKLTQLLGEYKDSLVFNSDTAAALLGRASLAIGVGNFTTAETLLKRGVELEPFSQNAYANLADLYRAKGDDDQGEKVLRQAVNYIYDSAESRHALGLLLVRKHQMEEALRLLQKAAEMRPEVPRFQYVYAVALSSSGKNDEALVVLQRSLKRHPYDESLLSLAGILSAKTGKEGDANEYFSRLKEIDPENPEYRQGQDGPRPSTSR